MDPAEARFALECLLFVAGEPLPRVRLCELIEVDGQVFDEALALLSADLEGRSLQIVEVAGGFRLVTRPRFHRYIERYFEPEPMRISKAGLECLAMIAYRQPITRPEVDAVRGVNSDGAMDSLLRKGLIKEVGRKDVPGRPILYATTQLFLEIAGLRDLRDLPAATSPIPGHLLRIAVEPDGDVALPLDYREHPRADGHDASPDAADAADMEATA